MPSSSAPPASAPGNRRAIAIWLLASCAMIAAMVIIGGITRLSESGLSIVEWNLVMGWIPPLSDAEWQRQFALYRQTSEFQLQFPNLDVEGFKSIYWWEYIHRVWGRLIGLVALAGTVWFVFVDRRTQARMKLHAIAIFVAVSLQGAIGYWMVTSGFVDRDDVSQYRLTIHLGVAIALLGYMLWLALGLLFPDDRGAAPVTARRLATGVAGIVFLTLLSGGLVAGINAGFIFNTWPLMDGGFVPHDVLSMSPWWLNAFENLGTVQFDHRMLAYATTALVLVYWLRLRLVALHSRARRAAGMLAGMVVLQVILGIATLLLVVPLPIAVTHQGGAVVLFALAIWNVWELSGPRKPA